MVGGISVRHPRKSARLDDPAAAARRGAGIAACRVISRNCRRAQPSSSGTAHRAGVPGPVPASPSGTTARPSPAATRPRAASVAPTWKRNSSRWPSLRAASSRISDSAPPSCTPMSGCSSSAPKRRDRAVARGWSARHRTTSRSRRQGRASREDGISLALVISPRSPRPSTRSWRIVPLVSSFSSTRMAGCRAAKPASNAPRSWPAITEAEAPSRTLPCPPLAKARKSPAKRAERSKRARACCAIASPAAVGRTPRAPRSSSGRPQSRSSSCSRFAAAEVAMPQRCAAWVMLPSSTVASRMRRVVQSAWKGFMRHAHHGIGVGVAR